ncbi:MAG: AAA family ATPase [Actinobacteria bacterium]|nr:AAA family ATPase [Actinomycetota bacterium]
MVFVALDERAAGGGFIRAVRFERSDELDPGEYPFTVPAVRALCGQGELELDAGVTFFAGDNGSGKSTLVEAIALAAGLNAEGGSRSFAFATRASESALGDHITLVRGARRPATEFFLRAESFYNVATQIEMLERVDPGLLASYGGRSLHERSHGESFLSLALHRFGPHGLYLLDEPESALSVPGCLAFLRRMHELANAGSQFVVATHSPILMALPGAAIVEIDEGGFHPVPYEQTQAYQLTSAFLASPERFLRHLLADEP